MLDLYEQVQAFTSQGEAIYTVDAKTSIQARQWMSATKAALPDAPVPVADRFRRMGAAPLRYALMGATGLTGPVHS